MKEMRNEDKVVRRTGEQWARVVKVRGRRAKKEAERGMTSWKDESRPHVSCHLGKSSLSIYAMF